MKPSDVKTTLTAIIRRNADEGLRRPVMLWGPPGVGKSAVVHQVAKELGDWPVIDVRALLLDPVDLRGIPSVEAGVTVWHPPVFLPQTDVHGECGILFLDEVNSAPTSMQGALYQLTLDGRLGEYELPPGWIVICAGNYESDRGVTNRMPTPLANRLTHIDFQVSFEDWFTWAVEHNVRPEILAFLKWQPALLHDFQPQSKEKAFPSPRSWVFTSDHLNLEMDPLQTAELVSGTIGEAASVAFESFHRTYRELPDPMLFLTKKDQKLPTKASTLYALCGAVSRVLKPKLSEGFCRLAQRLIDEVAEGGAEFSLLLVTFMQQSCPDIMETTEFFTWAEKNASIYV